MRKGRTLGISESLREVGLSNLGRRINEASRVPPKPTLPNAVPNGDDTASDGMMFLSSRDIGKPRSFGERVGREAEAVGLNESLNVE